MTERLVTLLWNLDQPEASQAAARTLLEAEAPLTVANRLRAELLAGGDVAPPAGESTEAWLAELAGPLKRRAIEHVRTADPTALLAAWEKLPRDGRVAVLVAARRYHAKAAGPAIADALASDDRAQVRAALGCLGALADEPRPPLSRFIDADDDTLAAALAVTQIDVDLTPLLAAHNPVAIRCAALRRTTDRGAIRAALEDHAWQVRAVATELAGPEEATPLLTHEREEVRLAAAQVLQR